MPIRTFTIRRPARHGFVAGLGAVAVLAASTVWAQESKSVLKDLRPRAAGRAGGAERDTNVPPGRTDNAPVRTDGRGVRDTRPDDDDLDPAHAEALTKARRQVELLEAQLGAKRARIELADARLKQVQDQLAYYKGQKESNPAIEEKIAMLQAEIPVRDAERDAEYAEFREPEVLLKHARREVEELERLARRPGLAGRLGRSPGYQAVDSMSMGYPMMGMGHPMMSMGYPMMGMGRTRESEQLDELRELVEDLRRDIDGLKRSRSPEKP
jgi:hypothetical protein